MNTTTDTPASPCAFPPSLESALWERVAQAENALYALTSGKVDAIIDPSGKVYLLHPVGKESAELLQAVIDSAADAITVVSRDGKVVSQSHAGSRLLGYEPQELLGKSIFDFVHAEDTHALYFALFEVIEGLRSSAMVCFRLRTRAGSWRFIEASVGKLRDDSSTAAVFSLRPHPSEICEASTSAVTAPVHRQITKIKP